MSNQNDTKQNGGTVAGEWIPIKDVLEAISGNWIWAYNSRCKYIKIQLDTRDQHCLISDREGVPITLEQLRYQYGQPANEKVQRRAGDAAE